MQVAHDEQIRWGAVISVRKKVEGRVGPASLLVDARTEVISGSGATFEELLYRVYTREQCSETFEQAGASINAEIYSNSSFSGGSSKVSKLDDPAYIFAGQSKLIFVQFTLTAARPSADQRAIEERPAVAPVFVTNINKQPVFLPDVKMPGAQALATQYSIFNEILQQMEVHHLGFLSIDGVTDSKVKKRGWAQDVGGPPGMSLGYSFILAFAESLSYVCQFGADKVKKAGIYIPQFLKHSSGVDTVERYRKFKARPEKNFDAKMLEIHCANVRAAHRGMWRNLIVWTTPLAQIKRYVDAVEKYGHRLEKNAKGMQMQRAAAAPNFSVAVDAKATLGQLVDNPSQVDRMVHAVYLMLNAKADFEELCITDEILLAGLSQVDRKDADKAMKRRRTFMDKLGLPFQTVIYSYGNARRKKIRFIWKVPRFDEDDSDSEMLSTLMTKSNAVIHRIEKDIPTYLTRQQTKDYHERFGSIIDSKAAINAILKDVGMNDAQHSSDEARGLPARLAEFISLGGPVELKVDLRALRSNPSIFDEWFALANKVIEEMNPAGDDRRHGDAEAQHLTSYTSIPDFKRAVKEKYIAASADGLSSSEIEAYLQAYAEPSDEWVRHPNDCDAYALRISSGPNEPPAA